MPAKIWGGGPGPGVIGPLVLGSEQTTKANFCHFFVINSQNYKLSTLEQLQTYCSSMKTFFE
jgi:hypothetical protein